MKTKNYSKLALALFALYGLSACNIDLGTDDEQTQADLKKTATGVIESVENFLLNNESYDISNANITLDGQPADKSQLKEGMVVSVSSVQSGSDNQALSIDYSDITEGVVRSNDIAINNSLDVMGQTVYIDNDTVFDDSNSGVATLSDLENGSVVEVSGFSSGDGEIWATRIEVKDSSYLAGEEIEVKGVISNLNDNSFSIGDLAVQFNATNVEYDLNQALQNGLYVEVESIEGFDANGALIASEIELLNGGNLEVMHDENDQEVELEGVLTQILDGSQIQVNGTTVVVTADTRFEHGNSLMLAEGVRLEVEGYVNADNLFVAQKIEFEDYSDDDEDSENELDDDDDDDDDDDKDDDNERDDD